jgi:1-deoxy-D-xylulose-5-phosphate synthase
VDGLTDVFRHVLDMDGPVLVHVLTTKGRGYQPAESNPTYFHGVAASSPKRARP